MGLDLRYRIRQLELRRGAPTAAAIQVALRALQAGEDPQGPAADIARRILAEVAALQAATAPPPPDS